MIFKWSRDAKRLIFKCSKRKYLIKLQYINSKFYELNHKENLVTWKTVTEFGNQYNKELVPIIHKELCWITNIHAPKCQPHITTKHGGSIKPYMWF